MVNPRVALVVGIVVLSLATSAPAQTAEALDLLLFRGSLFDERNAALRDGLPNEIATFPSGSSSGGFVWTFDPSSGARTRRSRSFGPMFAERAFTTGARKVNIAVAFQHTRFDSFDGEDLSALSPVEEILEFPLRERRTRVTAQSGIELTAQRTIVNATIGLTDRMDVGLVVPFGRTHVRGTASVREVTGFGPANTREVSVDETGAGIGDITLRTKVGLLTGRAFTLAGGVDLRVPSGDEQKLLGTGSHALKVMMMGASTGAAVAPHFNVGYVTSDLNCEPGASRLRCLGNEVHYTFGVDVAASDRITVAGDVIGRQIQDTFVGVRRSGRLDIDTEGEYGNLNLLLGAIGAKINVGGTWLLTGGVLFPLNDNGLKPKVTPVLGFERAF